MQACTCACYNNMEHRRQSSFVSPVVAALSNPFLGFSGHGPPAHSDGDNAEIEGKVGFNHACNIPAGTSSTCPLLCQVVLGAIRVCALIGLD